MIIQVCYCFAIKKYIHFHVFIKITEHSGGALLGTFGTFVVVTTYL